MSASRWIPLLALGAMLAMPVAAQQIYRWVDEQGKVHYTQTPPPAAEFEPAELRGDGRKIDPARADYCRAIRNFALQVVGHMRSRVPRDGAISAARAAEADLTRYVDDPAIQQVVNYVYGHAGGREVGGVIANHVHTQCMTGSYGRLRSAAVSSPPGRVAPGEANSRRAGSGFFVAGVVVTNNHVIDGGTRITLHLADGRTIQARVDQRDAEADIALLRPVGLDDLPPGLPVSAVDAPMGAEVFTLGFPLTDIMGANAKLSTGIVNSQTGVGDDPRTYQVSVPVQSGNSGGPLINRRGEVVGIITSKLAAERVFRYTGDLPQNVNYAVKASYLIRLAGIRPQRAIGGESGWESLVESSRASVVRIEVE